MLIPNCVYTYLNKGYNVPSNNPKMIFNFIPIFANRRQDKRLKKHHICKCYSKQGKIELRGKFIFNDCK